MDGIDMKPTGYTVTIRADELWLLLRCYGSTCRNDRMSKFGHPVELDKRISATWSKFNNQLYQDGFPKYSWSDNDE